MISDELFDRMLECWSAQIPETYRWTGKYYSPRGDPARGAIIGPKPGSTVGQILRKSLAAASRGGSTAGEGGPRAMR
jgi:hypothetical protein